MQPCGVGGIFVAEKKHGNKSADLSGFSPSFCHLERKTFRVNLCTENLNPRRVIKSLTSGEEITHWFYALKLVIHSVILLFDSGHYYSDVSMEDLLAMHSSHPMINPSINLC